MKQKEELINEERAESTPAGGVLIGERDGQTIIHDKGTMSGYLVGKLHKDGGIKAVNKATGQPLEMQGGEIVITAPAVSDTTKHNFNGKMMTNREILSKINSDGGGVSFADGGDIPAKINTTEKEYEYGGKMVHDSDIAHSLGMNSTLKKGKQQFYSGGMTYDVDAIYNAVKKGKIRLKTKEVDTFPMKYPVYDKQYSETVKTDLRKPNGIMVRLESGEEVLIDGNHRMNNAYLKGRKTMKTYYVEDPKQIAKFVKKSKFESGGENKVGGHLSKNKSLKQIAEMHNVSLAHINEELAKGLEVEKEHFSDFKERTRVAKDHLVENPNYYSILEKAGLKMGGHLKPHHSQKEDLVKDSKNGNTPARDLNNYNDVMDLEADGAVGGDSGLAFVDGGGLGLIKVDKIIITQDLTTNQSYKNLVGKEYDGFNDLKQDLNKAYGERKLAEPKRQGNGGFKFKVNDAEPKNPEFYFLFNDKKNTVANFNPITGKPSDLEKQLKNYKKITFARYDWQDWLLSKVKSSNAISQTPASTSSQQLNSSINSNSVEPKIVEAVNVEFVYPDGRIETSATINISNLKNALANFWNIVDKKSWQVRITPFENQFTPFKENSLIIGNDFAEYNPETFSEEQLGNKLKSLYSDLDWSYFLRKKNSPNNNPVASKNTKPFDLSKTKIKVDGDRNLSKKIQEKAFELGWGWGSEIKKDVQSTGAYCLLFDENKQIDAYYTEVVFKEATDYREITVEELFGSQTPTLSSKFTEGEIGLFKKIDSLIKDNSFVEVTLPINLWSKGADTKLFDLINDDTGEVFSFRSYKVNLGGVSEDSDNGRTVEILEKYVDWKSSGSQTPIAQNNKIEPYDAYATVLIWKDNSGKEIIERTDIFYGVSGATLISQLKNIEAQSQGRDVEVIIRAFADDDKGNQFEKNDYFTIGDYGFKPSTKTNEEIKEIVEEWIDGVNFDKFFEDVIPLKGNQTTASIPVVPKTVENTVYDLDLAISKLEKASSKVVIDYNKDVYEQSLKFLYDTKATYELALKFTPESAFMYERLDIMKKLADIEKNIKKIEDMKKGGTFYVLAKILEKLQRGENWRLMEQTQDVITNQLPQSEIDIIIRSQKFKNWFGNWEKALVDDQYDNVSKALTNGIPSVYHHGARRKKYTYREVSNGVLYLAENISYALWFSQNATAQSEEGNYLTECFVNIKNPIDLTAFHVKMIDLGDLVRYIDAIYPMAKIYDFIPAQVALLIKSNQPTNVMMWAWQLIRKYAKFVNHIKENTPYDGFLYYENNPSDEVLNPSTGQMEENVTKAVAIFKSPQVKVVDAVLFDGGLDDWRFENGGKIKN